MQQGSKQKITLGHLPAAERNINKDIVYRSKITGIG
jgi:hypothetical protein